MYSNPHRHSVSLSARPAESEPPAAWWQESCRGGDGRPCYREECWGSVPPLERETNMKALVAFTFIVATLMLGLALSACSDEVGQNYYDNDVHGGYPGPGTRTPGRDS